MLYHGIMKHFNDVITRWVGYEDNTVSKRYFKTHWKDLGHDRTLDTMVKSDWLQFGDKVNKTVLSLF